MLSGQFSTNTANIYKFLTYLLQNCQFIFVDETPLMCYTDLESKERGRKMAKDKNPDTTIARNKKAYHDYFVDETFEAGISLFGTEVKSLREGRVNLKDSYVSVKTGEAFLIGTHISPYEKGNIFNRDPLRERKLLLHKREINKLIGLTQQQGYTLIPLKMYFKGSYVKVLLGLCRGKKNYDKRDSIAERESKRRMDRALKDQMR